MHRTAEHGLDDPLHPILAQLVGELVQMHHLPLDEDVLSGKNGVLANRPAAIPPLRIFETGFGAQRVHRPRLARILRLDAVDGRGLERFARRGRVLAEQGLSFRPVKIPQAQRRGADGERPAARDRLALRSGVHPIVPHVAHPAQHDAVRETPRSHVVARPQLAEHREQRVAGQGIDFVDEEHHRLPVATGPSIQGAKERVG